MITAREIDLVQDSFAQVLPVTAAAAADFYGRLFALAPDTRALFGNDMAEQGRKLFLTLATIVDALDRLEQVIPVAEALAVRHVGYGVREQHYTAVGCALVETLKNALGAGFDRDTEMAWGKAYSVLAECMMTAARTAALDAVTTSKWHLQA